MAMTPRQRILAALEHREPDQVPIDFGGTDCSSIHILAYDRVRKRAGIEPRPLRLGCLMQQIAEVDPELLDLFGSDAQGLYFHPRLWRRWDSGGGLMVDVPAGWQPETQPDGSTVVLDAKGNALSRRPAGGHYFDPVAFCLSTLTDPEALSGFDATFARWDWPQVLDESVDEYAKRARTLYHSTDRAVVALWQMHYLQAGQMLRGFEGFMVDLLSDEAMARGILERLHAVYLTRTAALLDAAGPWLDIVFLTDDLGTQQGPLISPDLYRRLIKPYWAELIGLVKQRGKKVLMHSCGAISDFLPDLIEMGVDAINPVQITAHGMSPARLKRDFGGDVTFWGGGISTQGGLDSGSVAEVRDQVHRNIDIFAPGGGFVFTQVHNIQSNVPPETVLAAYDAVRDYRG